MDTKANSVLLFGLCSCLLILQVGGNLTNAFLIKWQRS